MATASSPAPPPPHSVLSFPILYLSGLPSSVADEEIVEALKDCLRLRLFLQRDEGDPSAPLSGKIEFETLDKAERAYATCNNQRLSSGHTLLLSLSPPSSSSDPEPQATPRIIKHLPSPFSASHLFTLCRPFGPLYSATLLLAPFSGGAPRFKGQALVTFYDEHDAEEMQRALHFTEVGGQSVAVQVWDAKRAAGGRGRASLGATPSPGLSPNEKVSRWAATQSQQETPSKFSRYAGLASTPSTPSAPMRRDVSGASASSTASRWSSEAGEVGQGGQGATAGPGPTGSDPRNLFIKNLDPSLPASSLHALFSPFGVLTSTSLALDPLTNRSKGFGFVAFERAEDAERALREVDGRVVEGRRVVVSVLERREVRRERLGREFAAREGKKEEKGVEEVRKGMEDLSTGPTTPSSSPPRTFKPVSPFFPSDAPSTPPQPQPQPQAESHEESEHDRLVRAVGEVLPDVAQKKREEVVRLIEGLPKKDRKMCLFNSEVLRVKVADAMGILEDEGEEAPTPTNDSPATAPATLPALALLPCSQILPLLPALSLYPSPSDLSQTHAFMDSLAGKPVSEVKQRLGEKVFRVVKELARERGVKGAPRITITLLDSEPDLRALAVVALHYREVLAEKVVGVAQKLAGE
ncbi:hypothetical protein RTBOTA2_002797 [Rhodotorula toruloides]|uniref:RRM domain-containing protein n=1 Tax=Rhodotorula toruloides TaxID=5286 RepID=A0A2T0A3C2_RHOTO|nr:hypothetical protein RTBOTA2_002797 [Rhodotorula toruloides]PRQ72456.1 hypothetical protein AAT19DRAFT_16380 [Rhodotorula toruloides]